MSQYPPPYQQPPYPNQGPFDFYRPAANPLGPARRASVLMFVLCGIGLLCGGFMTLFGVIMTPQMIAQAPNSAQLHEVESQLGGISLQTMMLVAGIICIIPSILYGVMGFLVRGGRTGSVVVSIVLTALTLVLIFIQVLGGIAKGGDPASLGAALCMMGIPLVLCIVLLVTLVKALRAAPSVDAMQQQFQAQYWQSMQQQQAAQLGYGYGMPPGYGYAAPPTQPPAPPGQGPVDYQAPLMPPPPPPAPPGATGYPNGPDEDPRH